MGNDRFGSEGWEDWIKIQKVKYLTINDLHNK